MKLSMLFLIFGNVHIFFHSLLNQQCWILEHIPFVLWKHPIYIVKYWCISIANWFLYLYAQEIALCKSCCQRNGWNQYGIRSWTLQIYASTRQTEPFWKALFSYHSDRIHNLFSQSKKKNASPEILRNSLAKYIIKCSAIIYETFHLNMPEIELYLCRLHTILDFRSISS